jgi:hypothetical protein
MRVLPTCLALCASALATAALAQAQSGGAGEDAPTTGTTTSTSTSTTPTTPSTSASKNPGQQFFHDALIKDTKTVSAIRKALDSGAAIVDPATQYADLTGDGKQDAVVRVHSTGAAGVIAVYVFSTDGSPKKTLRVLFRTQSLYRAVTAVPGMDRLQVDEPLYVAGDDVCCPSKLSRKQYRFSKKARAFTRISSKTITLAPPGR